MALQLLYTFHGSVVHFTGTGAPLCHHMMGRQYGKAENVADHAFQPLGICTGCLCAHQQATRPTFVESLQLAGQALVNCMLASSCLGEIVWVNVTRTAVLHVLGIGGSWGCGGWF